MTAAQRAAGLREKAFSAQELCRASISRTEALDPQISAIVVRDFERAQSNARMADEAMAKGQQRALTGIPVTVKESFDLRGHGTTWGLPARSEHVARQDALAVQRLKLAAAVGLGKTNVPQVLGDWQAAHSIYGRTNNPHDITRSPGGSSGGILRHIRTQTQPQTCPDGRPCWPITSRRKARRWRVSRSAPRPHGAMEDVPDPSAHDHQQARSGDRVLPRRQDRDRLCWHGPGRDRTACSCALITRSARLRSE